MKYVETFGIVFEQTEVRAVGVSTGAHGGGGVACRERQALAG